MTDQPTKEDTDITAEEDETGNLSSSEVDQLGETSTAGGKQRNDSALEELQRQLAEEGYIPTTPPETSDSDSGENASRRALIRDALRTDHPEKSPHSPSGVNQAAAQTVPHSDSEVAKTLPADQAGSGKHFTSDTHDTIPKKKLSKSGEMNGEVMPDKTPDVTTVDKKASGGFLSMSHEKRFTMITFCISNFCVGAFYSLLGPFFPQEAAKKGVNSTITGLIFGVFELTIILASPVAGFQISRVGAKFMFVCGIMICGTCAILFGFLDASPDGTIYIVMCFLVRTCEGLGAGAFITASFAILAFTFPDNVGAAFGSLEFFSGLGLMVGPPIGGALYQGSVEFFSGLGYMVGPPLGGLLYEAGGFRLPFISGGALVCCLGIASIFLLPNPEGAPKSSGGKLSFVFTPVILVVMLLLVTAAGCVGFIDVSLSVRLQEVYNFTPLVTGVVFLVGPGVYAFAAPLWGFIADKKPMLAEWIIVGGFAVGGVGFLVMGPAPFLPIPNDWLWLLLVSLGCMGFGVGTTVITFQLMNQAARDRGYPDNLDTYGMVSGLFSSFFSGGAFVGPIIAGALNDAMGFAGGAMVFGFATLACSVLMAIYQVAYIARRPRAPPAGNIDEESTSLLKDSHSSTRRSYTEA